jgi:hypothetical protein
MRHRRRGYAVQACNCAGFLVTSDSLEDEKPFFVSPMLQKFVPCWPLHKRSGIVPHTSMRLQKRPPGRTMLQHDLAWHISAIVRANNQPPKRQGRRKIRYG